MSTQSVTGAGSASSPHPGQSPTAPQQRDPRGKSGEGKSADRGQREITAGFVVGRIAALAITAAIVLYAVPPLVRGEHWIALTILGIATAAVGYLYLGRRHVAAKYLIPGTIFLIIFQIFPVLYTMSTAFTNYGDGHRGSKAEAIVAVQTTSVEQVPGSPEYQLTLATKGGDLVFLLTDPITKAVQAGTAEGLSPVDGAESGITGKILSAPGYTILSAGAANARGAEISEMVVPTAGGAIKANGLSRAVEGKAKLLYDAGCDCITAVDTGQKWVADEAKGYFANTEGNLAQGWQVNIGFDNFVRVFTDSSISGNFLSVLVWNLVFALASMLTTFILGLLVAVALHSPRVKGTRIYRTLLILPYAMPSFAMLLVWRDMFNTDYGLVNSVLGGHVDWFGQSGTARLALIMINLWLGFPYMFLVATGALQAIPKELTEASSIDGASPWQGFRKVTLPLLLVALTPLLIASFAFNFNNFNAIQLVTGGGPYAIDNSTVGATDLLITYTYRLAGFSQSSSAQYGLAATISIFIFAIVATISVIAFRRTRAQEEVYS